VVVYIIYINWVCVKDKRVTCKRKLKNNLLYEILSKANHSCLPNPAGVEVTVKLENCRKRATEESLCLFMQFIEMNCPLCVRIWYGNWNTKIR